MGSIREIDYFLSQPFTHLVVGGGTAGLVVATRLSEDSTITVGVLEAGPTALDEPRINVPGRLGETMFTEYDWQFETVPQAGVNDKKLPWNRGKVLGGSSALNFMMWCRGNKCDYDAWEKLGNRGWGWEGMLSALVPKDETRLVYILWELKFEEIDLLMVSPYFKKTENFSVPDHGYQEKHQAYFNQDYHGTDGPLHTIYAADYAAHSQHWHATLNKLGIETNRNHLSGSNVGCWTSLTGVDPKTQERCYSASAYYLPASGRENLFVLTEAMAGGVVLEKENDASGWIAKGVRFVHKEQEYTVHVRGEIILSAGTIQSPQLLELSGVGNPKILEAGGIETKIVNSNVGENLQDHVALMMVYELDPSIVSAETLRSDPRLAAAADEQYASSKTGLRTAVSYSAAYLPFSHYTTKEEISRIAGQLPQTDPATARVRDQILSERFSSPEQTGQIEWIFEVSNYNPYFISEPGKSYGSMMQMLQYPFSVGSIHIQPSYAQNGRTTTSDDKPVIDPRYYSGAAGQVDFLTMTAGLKFAHKICSTRPLADIIVKRVFPPAPADDDVEAEDLSSWVRDTTMTDWHPVGTCAMGGHEGIKGGVVDDRLRVYGVKGLRVCDASIMPLQISAHLQATVYAIGEKGADMIKEDWRAKNSL